MNNMSKNKNKDKAPDFLVDWTADDIQSIETIDLEQLARKGNFEYPGKLRNAMASLHTDTTHVEVSDLDHPSPMSLTFTPNRTLLSSLVATTAEVEYGYPEEGTVRVASVGSVLFMLPGRELQARATPGRLCSVTCSFDNEYAAQFLGPLDALSHEQLYEALDFRSSLISSILLRLMQEALAPGAISHRVTESLGQAILTECAHWLQAPAQDVKGTFTAREFQMIEHYLAGLTGKAPNVADLAALCGFSERYFAKLFRDFTGVPISQYIKAVQLSKAKALLLETSLPLKEIAYRLGFSSTANFTASFRTATGIAPGQYRKSH